MKASHADYPRTPAAASPISRTLDPLEPRQLLAASITGLTLINANNNRPVEKLDYGDTIDLAEVGRHLSIAADPVDAESVRFNYDGDSDHRIDNAAPYAIAGDRRRGRDYLPFTPTLGTHTLIVTPYAHDDGAGAPGQSRVVLFNVIDSRARGRGYSPPARGGGNARKSAPPASLPMVPAPLYVNAGGGTFTDSLGRVFRADSNFTGGFTGNTATDIANTTDDALYHTYRTGEHFSFSHPVANGNYSLWLHFAEPTATQAGERTFDVSAEGRQVLDDFDIVPSAGPNVATTKSFNVNITDQKLDLAFTGVTGEAIVSGLVLVPIDVPPEMKPYSTLCASEAAKQVRSQTNLRIIGQGIFIYASDNKGRLPPDLATLVDIMGMTVAANPRSSTSLPRGELTLLERRAWVASQWPQRLVDYIYLGAGKRSVDFRRDDPLAYENPDRVSDDVNVLFGDGHVERLSRSAAAALIGFPNLPPSDPSPASDSSTDPTCQRDPAVTESALNLRQIAQALLLYANHRKGQYPPDLGTLFSVSRLDLDTFLNPRGDTPAPVPDLSQQEQIDWINTSNDYLYIRRRYFDSGEVVLAYENPAEMKDGINILFNDGHVEFREMRWAVETLRRAGITGVV